MTKPRNYVYTHYYYILHVSIIIFKKSNLIVNKSKDQPRYMLTLKYRRYQILRKCFHVVVSDNELLVRFYAMLHNL